MKYKIKYQIYFEAKRLSILLSKFWSRTMKEFSYDTN